MRRILFAQKFASLGGGQVSLVQHLERLDRQRFEPRVVVSNEGWLTRQLERLGIAWTLMPFGHWGNLAALPGNLLLVARLRRYLRQHRIDLVHANEHWVGPPCGIAAAKEGVPSVCHFRTGLEDLTPHRVRKYRYGEFDRVVVVADVLRRALAPLVRDPRRVAVVRDAVDPPAEAPPFRRRPSRCIVLDVGALYAVKGQAKILERALPWLKANARRYLVFVGGTRTAPSYVEDMKRRVAENGLGRQVRFLGSREDVARLLGFADALVAYSSVEGIPRVVMEAMAAARPVIVSATAGMDEVVADGEVGRILDFDGAGNPLAQALEDLAARPQAWRAMGARARDLALARHTPEAMSRALQALYNELLHGQEKNRAHR